MPAIGLRLQAGALLARVREVQTRKLAVDPTRSRVIGARSILGGREAPQRYGPGATDVCRPLAAVLAHTLEARLRVAPHSTVARVLTRRDEAEVGAAVVEA